MKRNTELYKEERVETQHQKNVQGTVGAQDLYMKAQDLIYEGSGFNI